MLKRTKYYKADSERDWFQWSESLLDLYDTEKQFVTSSVYRTSHLGMRRWILGQSFEGKELLLRNMLLDAMLSADSRSPGSEVYVPWLVYQKENSYISMRKSSSDYLDATLKLTKSIYVKDIFSAIHRTVGPLTKIVLKI